MRPKGQLPDTGRLVEVDPLLALLHGRESVVIFLVLFLWHLYDVHFRPEVFPMDWSWITGRISLADLQERHPLEYERLRNSGAIDGDGNR